MKKPLLLHYYITDKCNAKCEFCSIWETGGNQNAKLEDVSQNLAAARKIGAKFVDFTGGEPLLNPNLSEFLEIAKKLKFITSVTTNTLLFEKYAEKLSGKIDLLHFSIDGTKEIHDKIRGVKSFDRVVDSISAALKNKLYPDLLFTYTDKNIDCVKEIYEIAKKNKLILILDPVFSTNGENLISDDTHKKAQKFAKLGGVYLNAAHLILRKKGGNNVKNPVCKAIDGVIVILPDNTLALPCYHKFRVKLNIDKNLPEILKSKDIAEFKKLQGRLKICENCHINCYMDPSYQYCKNSLFFASIFSKLKYCVWKYLIYKRKPPF
ncbi:MAG: radical SAM protein [Chitinispirillales bacterium]|jgi:MoaA/NifB/PqqE/SkfB family radical SAM enzyme|nr:radical SAM protein [Chitinispirillales bacterium]